MKRGHLLQVRYQGHEVDWQKASQCIHVVGPQVVVEMVPEPEKVGSIYIGDGASAEVRADMGVVIASQIEPKKVQGEWIDFPKPGTVVCVWPEDGTWIEDAFMGDYKPKSQIRVYGAYNTALYEPEWCDWWHSIPCYMNEQREFRAYGDKIIIEFDPVAQSQGGILLPDNAKTLGGMATIYDVGPLEKEVLAGQRAVIDGDMVLHYGLQFDMSEKHKRMAVIDKRAIKYIVNE